jgi:glycosyltransferase involved in cell wall biosynthesis
VKRVERFFELARRFPNVEFIAAGMAYNEARDKELRVIGSEITNLKMPGVVVDAEKDEILEKSWIMVNTSFHESLPTTYLEACAYKGAMLISENPDDFASNFGFQVQSDDFESGLAYLLEGNRWREKGEMGFEYVSEVHELNKVVDQHIRVYENLLGRSST